MSTLSKITLQKEQIQKIIEDNQKLVSDLERDEKAFDLLYGVEIVDNELAIVTSGQKEYHVKYMAKTCTCPDHKFRGTVCKHIRAVLLKVKLLNELGK